MKLPSHECKILTNKTQNTISHRINDKSNTRVDTRTNTIASHKSCFLLIWFNLIFIPHLTSTEIAGGGFATANLY